MFLHLATGTCRDAGAFLTQWCQEGAAFVLLFPGQLPEEESEKRHDAADDDKDTLHGDSDPAAPRGARIRLLGIGRRCVSGRCVSGPCVSRRRRCVGRGRRVGRGGRVGRRRRRVALGPLDLRELRGRNPGRSREVRRRLLDNRRREAGRSSRPLDRRREVGRRGRPLNRRREVLLRGRPRGPGETGRGAYRTRNRGAAGLGQRGGDDSDENRKEHGAEEQDSHDLAPDLAATRESGNPQID